MTPAGSRYLVGVSNALARLLPEERRQWVEAITAEASSVPAGRRRVGWLLGSLAFAAGEVGKLRAVRYAVLAFALLVLPALFPVAGLSVLLILAAGYLVVLRRTHDRWPWPPRPPGARDRWAAATHALIVGAVVAVVALVPAVVLRYPEVLAGSGTPVFATLLVVVLTGYLAATLVLTRTGAATVRYALPAGLATAAAWTLGHPAGGSFQLTQPWLRGLSEVAVLLAFAGGPLLAGTLAARRSGVLETGVAAGAAAGMYAALTNLIGGLVLVMLAPGYVPFDSDVLRHHHTPAAILGADVGETLVVFIGLLLVWPVVGTLLGTLGGAFGAGARGRPAPAGDLGTTGDS